MGTTTRMKHTPPPLETGPPEDDLHSPIVTLNVGGTLFVTRECTLRRVPNTRLSELSQFSQSYVPEKDSYYFDRDPLLFSHILNCYRWGEIHIPTHVCPYGYRKEMEFWGIPECRVASCCWAAYYQVDSVVRTIGKLTEVTSRSQLTRVDDGSTDRKLSWRMKMWLFLEDPHYSKGAMIWDIFYMLVVLVSVCLYIVWMEPTLRVEPYLNHVAYDGHDHINDKIQDMVSTDPHVVLFTLDTICMVIFLIEFILHFCVSPSKIRFFTTWYNVLNLVLSITMVVSFSLELRKDLISSHAIGTFYYVIKSCNIFRLLMLARFERQFVQLKVLFLSVRESKRELFLLVFMLIVCVCIFGGLIFCAEIRNSTFSDIWVCLWWALVTMTTVGYGDIYPEDLFGRIVGSLCAMCGLLILALPIGVIASNFARYNAQKEYQLQHNRNCEQNLNDRKLQNTNSPELTNHI